MGNYSWVTKAQLLIVLLSKIEKIEFYGSKTRKYPIFWGGSIPNLCGPVANVPVPVRGPVVENR